MKLVEFTEKEKADMFDKIASHFYKGSFSGLSKTDMELLMFHFYIDKLIQSNSNPDGTIDYSKCSDYKISKDLGITQQKVRNLKIKNQLTYPIEFDWKTAFARLTENARYDSVTRKITLNIPDPNLYLEIQNFIEEEGAYVEKQLNSKVLKIRVEYYVDLVISLEEDEENRKKLISTLKKEFKSQSKEERMFDEKQIGKSLLDGAVNVTSIIANISSLLSSENIVGAALVKLISKGAELL